MAEVLATTPEYLDGDSSDPLPDWDGPNRTRAGWVAARYGIDPSIALQIVRDLEAPPPDQVFEAMEEVREARRSLRRAANRLESLFGPIDHPDAPDEFEDEQARAAPIFPVKELTVEEMFDNDARAYTTIEKALKPYDLKRSDFRPNYSDATIWRALEECSRNPIAVEMLRSMTIPMEHRPGISRGKAARHDLKGKGS